MASCPKKNGDRLSAARLSTRRLCTFRCMFSCLVLVCNAFPERLPMRFITTADGLARDDLHAIAECRFTRNETTLLKLFVEGHSQKTAANEMNVSIHTVSFHCRNIY